MRVLPVDDVELRYADAVRVGAVVSAAPSKTTVTGKLVVPMFPAASVAAHVTVVIPIGNRLDIGVVVYGPSLSDPP